MLSCNGKERVFSDHHVWDVVWVDSSVIQPLGVFVVDLSVLRNIQFRLGAIYRFHWVA